MHIFVSTPWATNENHKNEYPKQNKKRKKKKKKQINAKQCKNK